MSLAIAVLAAGLISGGFFWTLLHDIPEIARRHSRRR